MEFSCSDLTGTQTLGRNRDTILTASWKPFLIHTGIFGKIITSAPQDFRFKLWSFLNVGFWCDLWTWEYPGKGWFEAQYTKLLRLCCNSEEIRSDRSPASVRIKRNRLCAVTFPSWPCCSSRIKSIASYRNISLFIIQDDPDEDAGVPRARRRHALRGGSSHSKTQEVLWRSVSERIPREAEPRPRPGPRGNPVRRSVSHTVLLLPSFSVLG